MHWERWGRVALTQRGTPLCPCCKCTRKVINTCVAMRTEETYMVLLLIEHEGSDVPTLIGAGSSLSANTDGGAANTEMVGGARNSMERRRYCDVSN